MLLLVWICILLVPVAGFVVPLNLRSTPSQRFSATGSTTGEVSSVTTEGREWALIFDCDGVILESESLHREAYNAVFREFEVEYNWSPEYYDELQNKAMKLAMKLVTGNCKRARTSMRDGIIRILKNHQILHTFDKTVGGGKPKMRFYFGENGWPASKLGGPPRSDEEKNTLIDSLQDRKTTIYKDFVADGTAVLRPGIQRVIDETLAISGGKMAICSASTKDACLFVLESLLGRENLDKFDLILAGDDVPRRKPDPMIYALASEKLGVAPERCMVIEDSVIGLEAALGAGMNCVITYTDSTESQEFEGAVRVYPELGESEGSHVSAKELLGLMRV